MARLVRVLVAEAALDALRPAPQLRLEAACARVHVHVDTMAARMAERQQVSAHCKCSVGGKMRAGVGVRRVAESQVQAG